MKRMKRIISILYVIAIVLVIITAAFQIYRFFNPDEGVSDDGIWKYIMFVFPLVDIIIVTILRLIEIKNEKKSYIDKDILFTDKFSAYIEKKNEILCTMSPSAYPEEVLRQCLHLITDCLKEYIGEKYYFEVSIFTNVQEPYIFAYYDTNGNNKPSSYVLRQNNPQYYIEKGYEVIELLKAPSSRIFIIPSTKEFQYNFINEKQRKHISSQIMYCFHMESPYVLVITCDKANAFKTNDLILKNFVQNIGRILNSDILIKEHMCCNNEFRCGITGP